MRTVFSKPTLVADAKVSEVISMCEARIKHTVAQRIGRSAKPAVSAQKSTRATSSASSDMRLDLRVEFRPLQREVGAVIALHRGLRAIAHRVADPDRNLREAPRASGKRRHIALQQQTVFALAKKLFNPV